MHTHELTVRMHHTDAAGVVFFAQFFMMAHEAYEAALEARGAPLGAWLREAPAPLVHTEADYLKPLRLSDRVRVCLGVERLGGRSFTVSYAVYAQREGGWELAARLRSVHVVVAPGIGAARALPPWLRDALSAIGPPEGDALAAPPPPREP